MLTILGTVLENVPTKNQIFLLLLGKNNHIHALVVSMMWLAMYFGSFASSSALCYRSRTRSLRVLLLNHAQTLCNSLLSSWPASMLLSGINWRVLSVFEFLVFYNY